MFVYIKFPLLKPLHRREETGCCRSRFYSQLFSVQPPKYAFVLQILSVIEGIFVCRGTDFLQFAFYCTKRAGEQPFQMSFHPLNLFYNGAKTLPFFKSFTKAEKEFPSVLICSLSSTVKTVSFPLYSLRLNFPAISPRRKNSTKMIATAAKCLTAIF